MSEIDGMEVVYTPAISERLDKIAETLFKSAEEMLGEIGNQKVLRQGTKVAGLAQRVEKLAHLAAKMEV